MNIITSHKHKHAKTDQAISELRAAGTMNYHRKTLWDGKNLFGKPYESHRKMAFFHGDLSNGILWDIPSGNDCYIAIEYGPVEMS